jgi:iron complex transport system substrate-binding protein
MKIASCLVLFVSGILVCSCSGRHERQTETISSRRSGAIIYAERFTLQKTDSCTIVTILNPWQGANGINHVYYLVNRDSELSCNADPASIIYVPVKKIICMSTTHLAMIKALEEENTIYGISGAGYIYDKNISGKVKSGQISDIGYEAGLNNELIINISPDLVMLYGIGSESSGYLGKIMELGVKVMFNADYLENDPLGKAEWIKLFGALYCKEESALKIFNNVSREYNQIKAFIDQNTDTRPEVLLGLPFRDTWYISPGNSYISKLINDAGGNYLWENTVSASSMPMGIENVYLQALKAEFWLNIGNVNSKNELVAIDPRLESIPCFQKNNLYNNNKRITSMGGNDYWESGTLNPHIILKDIASILHPGLFGKNELYYYRIIE